MTGRRIEARPTSANMMRSLAEGRMSPEEYARLDATDLAELIRRAEVSPAQVLEAAIARAEAINPQLNAIVRAQYDEARRRLAHDSDLLHGPFHGVPILLKDGVAQAGVPAPSGSGLNDMPAAADSTLLRRYRAAGFNVMGRTNMPEWGLCAATTPRAYGPCRNPWNPEFNAGGSSGGAAAAVAAGIVPVASGGDGAGSIRIPASCCGVFGFKPTRYLTPNGPGPIDVWGGLVTQHVLSRSVRDSAAVLDATSGSEPGDTAAGTVPSRRALDAIASPQRRLRIAWSVQAPGGVPVDAECSAAVDAAARMCADLGHQVEPATMETDDEALWQAWRELVAGSCATDLRDIEAARGLALPADALEDVTRLFIEHGRRLAAVDILAAQRTIQRESRRVAAFFANHDVYLTPTLATLPPELNRYAMMGHASLDAYIDELFHFIPYTPLANMTGQPAMSVPMTHSTRGLPIGVHFSARWGEDDVLFGLAAELEQARA